MPAKPTLHQDSQPSVMVLEIASPAGFLPPG